MKPIACVLGHIDGKFIVAEPPLAFPAHFFRIFVFHVSRDGLAHRVRLVHDVVTRHFRQLGRLPRFQRIGVVAAPVGALEVEISAQEFVQAGLRVCHFVVGWGGAVVPFVVFARSREVGEVGFHVDGFGRWGGAVGGVEWEAWGAFERVGHEGEALEEIGARECAQRGRYGAEVVADETSDFGVAKGVDERDGVFDQVQGAEVVGWNGAFGGIGAALEIPR